VGAITTTTDIFGAIVSLVTNEGGNLNNINLSAQLAATSAGEAASATGAAGPAAIMLGGMAFGTGLATLASDISAGKPNSTRVRTHWL